MRFLAAVCGLAMLVGACESASPRTPLPVPEGSGHDVTAFVGATVVTMVPKLEAGARLEEQTVLVRGGHIVVVGPTSRVRVPAGAKAIDARGKVLLPGLVDAHVHLAHAEDLPLYVARGVTTVRNMWGAPIHGMAVHAAATDDSVVFAESYHPHQGAWTQMTMRLAPNGSVRSVTLAGDGATGRGSVAITRPEPGRLRAEGTLLSGDRVAKDIPIDPAATVVVDRFLAGLSALPLGNSPEVKVVSLTLGSTLDATPETWAVRSEIGGIVGFVQRVEISTGKGPPRVALRDGSGTPTSFTMSAFGANLVWKKQP